MNVPQALPSSFLKKTKPIKRKKIVNISYLIMLLIKMRLLIFFVLSRYGLACKYKIISQISLYNWMQNCIFLVLHFHIFKIKLQLVEASQMVCHMMS